MVTTEGIILFMSSVEDVSETGLLSVGLEVACGVGLDFAELWTSEVPGAAPQARSSASETIIVTSAMPQRKPVVNRCILLVCVQPKPITGSVSLSISNQPYLTE